MTRRNASAKISDKIESKKMSQRAKEIRKNELDTLNAARDAEIAKITARIREEQREFKSLIQAARSIANI